MFSIIQAAGWPIWPLLLCSVVALALIIERLYHLREGGFEQAESSYTRLFYKLRGMIEE